MFSPEQPNHISSLDEAALLYGAGLSRSVSRDAQHLLRHGWGGAEFGAVRRKLAKYFGEAAPNFWPVLVRKHQPGISALRFDWVMERAERMLRC